MKLFAAAVAFFIAATADAAALPDQDCAFPVHGCKRAVDTTAEFKRSADALPDFNLDRWCAFPGQGCKKSKRAADAVSEYRRSAGAIAEAVADLDQE